MEKEPKLLRILESERDQWYENLSSRLTAKIESGDLKALSDALGHDPEGDEDDCLSPQELAHDPGWAWDCVRGEFLSGRGQEDPYTTLGIAKALGIDTSGLENETDWDSLIAKLTPRI